MQPTKNPSFFSILKNSVTVNKMKKKVSLRHYPFFSWVRALKKDEIGGSALKLNQGLKKVLEIQKKPTL